MLKLTPIKSDKVWGYEQWICSTHPNGLQKDFYSLVQDDYPLLVKVIQADQTLSVQVHPDDQWAVNLEGEGNRGKTECWYVLDAKPNSKIVYGLKPNVSNKDLHNAIKEKSLEQYLEFKNVSKGDFIFIPSGTVHAIGGGLRLLEVQQSCDLTYRLYDWGRDRQVHIEKALSVINSKHCIPILPFTSYKDNYFKCDYFSLKEVHIKDEWEFINNDSQNKLNTKLLFILFSKNAIIEQENSSINPIELKEEEIFAILPGEKISIKGLAKVILIEPVLS